MELRTEAVITGLRSGLISLDHISAMQRRRCCGLLFARTGDLARETSHELHQSLGLEIGAIVERYAPMAVAICGHSSDVR